MLTTVYIPSLRWDTYLCLLEKPTSSVCIISYYVPLLSRKNRSVKCNKSWEQRLNLSRSWHKSTLVLTIPRSLFKSYAKDLSTQIFELVFQHHINQLLCWLRGASMLWSLPRRAMFIRDIHRVAQLTTLSSMDSGLEAFSRNPTHGSFSALTFQSTEFANYANQRFLSY